MNKAEFVKCNVKSFSIPLQPNPNLRVLDLNYQKGMETCSVCRTIQQSSFDCFFGIKTSPHILPCVVMQLYSARNRRFSYMLDVGRIGQPKQSCTSISFRPTTSSNWTQNMLVSCGTNLHMHHTPMTFESYKTYGYITVYA